MNGTDEDAPNLCQILDDQLLLINDNIRLDLAPKKSSSSNYHTKELEKVHHVQEHAAAQQLNYLDYERMGPQTIEFLEKHNILQKLEEDARKFN